MSCRFFIQWISGYNGNCVFTAWFQTFKYLNYKIVKWVKVRAIPEPPINVQVEAGPQEGTLLLTWLPVTIEPSGFSNGALVKGYVVYADGQRTKEAKGATS
jgi:hypothetical protein